MKRIILMLILIVFIIGCVTEKVSENPIEEEAKAYKPDSTPVVAPPVDENPAENNQSNPSNKNNAPAEKPMQRGSVDPDLVVEKYDPEKAMDGTTLFPDNHNIAMPRIAEVNMLGEVIWEYYIPEELRRYTNPGFDAEPLPNNNILFVLPGSGVYEIDRDGKIVWSYKTAKISHDADRLPNGNTLIAFGNNDQMSDAQVKEINPKGEVVWSWYSKSYFDNEQYSGIQRQGWTHTNAVLRMNNGDTLVSPRNFNMLVQVNPEGEVVKTIGKGIMSKQHDPVFLSNGNLLFANHAEPNKAIEIDQNENIVWEFEITNPRLWPVRDANRLPNGNTLITGATKIIEVTPDKEIVWTLAIKDTSAFTKETVSMYGFYKAERIVK